MGMDVYGKAATTEEGKYFRNNAWWWRPLASYCCEVAPEITAPCKYWQSNDGDGLDALGALALADVLESEIKAGRTLLYEKRYMGELEASPNVPCRICAGTGIRPPVPECGAGDPNKGGFKCNGCHGNGSVRPNSASYPFSVENVQEFITFLRGSGGFEIC